MLRWLRRLIGRKTSGRGKNEMDSFRRELRHSWLKGVQKGLRRRNEAIDRERYARFMLKPAAREMLEHWNDFSFGDGREEEYPLDELRALQLDRDSMRHKPKLSDEFGE